MIKGRCIYCKEEKDLNREHAFPESLLQKGVPGWTINNHLCVTCNSNLGKLDVALSKRSHIAFVWDQLQRELGDKTEGLHASIYHKRVIGIDPTRLFLRRDQILFMTIILLYMNLKKLMMGQLILLTL